MHKLFALAGVLFSLSSWGATSTEDPFLWLEEIEGKKPLEWVKTKNESTLKTLTEDARYSPTEKEVRKILLAEDRIPFPILRGKEIHNFWQDSTNVKGLWRKTSFEEYRKSSPKWETVLDIDALAKKENENWVYKGANCVPPEYRKCLITLSRGGKDASVIREFDAVKKEFVAGGFAVPEAKSSVSWMDGDTVWVATDFGPGTLTKSGYPRIVKLWKRGTPMANAKVIYEGKDTDMEIEAFTYFRPEGNSHFVSWRPTFFENVTYLYTPDKGLKKIPFPMESSFEGSFNGRVFAIIRKELVTPKAKFKEGSLVAFPLNDLDESKAEAVFVPNSTQSVEGISFTKNGAILHINENVAGKLLQLFPPKKPNPKGWTAKAFPLPKNGSVSILSANAWDKNYFSLYQSFLVPQTLYLGEEASGQTLKKFVEIKKVPERFDASGAVAEQFFVKSTDGTKIPYFLVRPKKMKYDGSTPTLLYAYGGFLISLTPGYLSATGKTWTEKGGAYVIANIRGGAEYGPTWHSAGLKENRQKVFDDFAAVAKDLIERKITSPQRLGIRGGSNGGLLMGASFTQHPELFKAVVCQVPLLDMLRYNKLLAGASWEGEYGNPDDPKTPQIRDAILKYSPYQNLQADKKYPKVFFMTSTLDDRVHPGHARKMAAKMEAQNHPFFYFENTEGGHAGVSNLEQEIKRASLMFVYLYQMLMPETKI
ncbi:prolyl oligopeptidase family serine peptidase [bacterium]|jgi:prolyl oligopeptidase|nr:prolyl oligopeptidase family serine peptidase [bacterium]